MGNEKNVYEVIGENVMETQERRRRYIEEHTSEWLKVGTELRKVRNGLKISQGEIAACIGCSKNLVSRFESGKSVKRRNMVEGSYRSALELIPFRRRQDAGLI